MAEILKEWLTERLQRPIKWEAEEFGAMMKDGQVLASVLYSYHVINEEKLFFIRSSTDVQEITCNWSYLTQWLREINIVVTDQDVSNLMNGRGTSLLRLFYQIFLNLDRRDRTDFIKRERKMVSTLVEKMGSRFKVDKVKEEEESIPEELSKPLLNEKHFIEWQRSKSDKVKETYDYIRYKYTKIMEKLTESRTPMCHTEPRKNEKLTSKEKEAMDRFGLSHPCKAKNYTYAELMKLEEDALERRKSLLDTEWSKNYMANLYSKINTKSCSEEFQNQLRNVMSSSMWDMTVVEEETKLDTELAKKVMKLSQFEKQMCTQIMETKQQARNLAHNRIQAEKEFAEEREQQFNQYLDNVKEQIHLEVVEIDFEKQRQNMLHKKLYAEKMKRKKAHYFEICYETMLALVDFATKYAYFKRLLGEDIPDHYVQEWKKLFYKRQPIFDILDPVEDLLKEHDLEEELTPEVEELNRLELDRQEALNDCEFIEYHEYAGPWRLDQLIPNFEPDSEERKIEYLGLRVLGHVVFTLLKIKYPLPPPREPADLPDFAIRALLRGLPDRSITQPMQTLLNQRKVIVVRAESAINFCLKKFKTEMIGCTDIELAYDKFTAAAQNDNDKELIRLMKLEEEASIKSNTSANPTMFLPIPANCKNIQTPKCIPEEEIVLSTAAELGRYVYEAMSFGESLTDNLLATMFVEYLKDQDDINGFVIVCYPNSYREAQILEEIFSGREPPDEANLDDRDDIYLEESIAKHRKKEKDPYKNIRVSRVFFDPHKKLIDEPFKSYFTCYMKMKETEDIIQEDVVWYLTEENSEFIDRFYAALGMNYSVYYEVIDKELMAQVCKYIIGDFSLPLPSADDLFGDHVLSQLAFLSSDDKRMKSKIIKTEATVNNRSKDKLKGSKSSKSTISDNELEGPMKSTSDFHVESEEVAHEIEHISLEEVPVLIIKAGEEEWDYGEIPISELIGIACATCWEQTEKTYIHDMGQLFLAKRISMNCLVPYSRFIKDKINQIIMIPSNKQDLVIAFQQEYNDFENDWRDINLMKNEWHCRVKELQRRLYHICDERKLFAEKQRSALICDNWTMEELTSLVNTYISCMQTELNRFTLSYQAMHDFYYAMLKRLPTTDRLTSKELPKISKEPDDSVGKKSVEDKVFLKLKAAFIDLQLKNIQIDYKNNPFNLFIENTVKAAMKMVADTNDTYRTLIAREYTEVAKIVIPIKKKDEISAEVDSIEPEALLKQNMLKCIEEWIMGINGEMYRMNLRLLALQHKCYRDMKLFNDIIYNTFQEVQKEIDTYYMNEIKSVDRLCKYFQMVVEDGRRMSESLILEHDTFIIDPNLLQYIPPPSPPGSGEPKEMVTPQQFRMAQLARLRSQFKICAPTGICLQQAFIYVLQDFIFYGKESGDGPLFPDNWKNINPEEVPKFVYAVFGDTSYVDWRDFLIYCLNLRFPSITELLEMRKKYRCKDLLSTELISREDYFLEKLWFEDENFDPEDQYGQLRMSLIKNFLFELFETSADVMNYSALLLAFCKHEDPIRGFAGALSLAAGKIACFSFEECEQIVNKLVEDKRYRDACLACAHSCTEKFLDKLLTDVVDYCAGTTISEIEYVEEAVHIIKKKGKGGGKPKKVESQSARLPKTKVSPSKSKTIQSATDVKTTYVCTPCQEPPEEEVPELPVEEEQRSASLPSLIEDPNVVYSISQEVLWKILKICLPWHFQLVPEAKVTPYVGIVEEVMKKLAKDTDQGDIYISKFVAEPSICKFLHKVKKFTAVDMLEEVEKICE